MCTQWYRSVGSRIYVDGCVCPQPAYIHNYPLKLKLPSREWTVGECFFQKSILMKINDKTFVMYYASVISPTAMNSAIFTLTIYRLSKFRISHKPGKSTLIVSFDPPSHSGTCCCHLWAKLCVRYPYFDITISTIRMFYICSCYNIYAVAELLYIYGLCRWCWLRRRLRAWEHQSMRATE